MRPIFILIVSIFMFSCSENKDDYSYDYNMLLDTYEKSEEKIKIDLQIVSKMEYLSNENFLPDDLFTVKYSEKQRWINFLIFIEKYEVTPVRNIELLRNHYDITKTGITIDKILYYDVEKCPNYIHAEQYCDSERVFLKL